MVAYFPNGSNILVMSLILGTLPLIQKVFCVLIGTIGWGGEYFGEMGCTWSAMVVYIRGYTTPLTILFFCVGIAAAQK